jgi:hypothetical protein
VNQIENGTEMMIQYETFETNSKGTSKRKATISTYDSISGING